MKRLVCCLVLLLTLCIGLAAHAEIYQVQLDDWLGVYDAYNGFGEPVDFGQQFSSIQSLSISWRGRVQVGFDDWGFYVNGRFKAEVRDAGGSAVAYTPWIGDSLYPQPFNQTIALTPANGSWNYLLDGKCNVWAIFEPDYDEYVDTPLGELESATLTLDATPVPEPSGLLALACGIGGLGSLMVRFRKK